MMIKGSPVTEKELKCKDLIKFGIFNYQSLNSQIDLDPWVERFCKGEEGENLFEWFKLEAKINPIFKPNTKVQIETLERYTLMVLIRHLGLIDSVKIISKYLSDYVSDHNSLDKFQRIRSIAKKMVNLVPILKLRLDLKTKWEINVGEKSTDLEIFGELEQNPTIIKELCEMKQIKVTSNNKENFQSLLKRLKYEIELNNREMLQENLFSQTYEKLIFLLTMPICENFANQKEINEFSKQITN